MSEPSDETGSEAASEAATPPLPSEFGSEAGEAPSLEDEIERVGRRPLTEWRSPSLMLAIAAFSLYLAFSFRTEVRYFFSSPEPIALVKNGDIDLGQAVPNRYVAVKGLPSLAKVQYRQLGHPFKVFYLLGTRVFVRAELEKGKAAADGSWRVFHVKGRLLDLVHNPEFVNIREWYSEHTAFDFSRPAFIILDDIAPRSQWQYPLAVGLLLLFALLNIVLLAKRLLRRQG